jgi:hypothetical protein
MSGATLHLLQVRYAGGGALSHSKTESRPLACQPGERDLNRMRASGSRKVTQS